MRDVDVQINVPPLLRINAQTIALSVMFVSACPSLEEDISGIRERHFLQGGRRLPLQSLMLCLPASGRPHAAALLTRKTDNFFIAAGRLPQWTEGFS